MTAERRNGRPVARTSRVIGMRCDGRALEPQNKGIGDLL